MAGTPRTIRKLAALVAAPALLFVACGDDSTLLGGGDGADVEAVAPPDFAPTARYLQTVADKSSGEAYRYEMFMGFNGEADTDGTPVATGEQAGDRGSVQMDMAVMFETIADQMGQPMPPGLDGVDLTMDMVVTPSDLYMRMPGFADLAAQTGTGGAEGELLSLLADWGRVDLSQLTGTDPEDLQRIAGGSGYDPEALMDTLRNAEGAQELDATEVRGEPMTGVSAEVQYADLLAAQGTDLEELESVMPGDELEAMADVTMEMSVWIDSDGYLGRIGFVMDMEQMAESTGQPAGAVSGMEMNLVMDFYDYGASDIEIEEPTGATDITQEMGDMMESTQGTGG